MVRLQIPDITIPAFKGLASMSLENADIIISILKEFPVGGSPEQLRDLMSGHQFLEEIPNLDETLFSFGSLLVYQEDKDVKDLAKDLSLAYAEKNEVSEGEISNLQEILFSILSNADSLKKTFKAYYLFAENQRTYRSNNIITDTRFLFNDVVEESPTCGIIIHQLKIEYNENNEKKSTYISLLKEDLLELNEKIQRALNKEEVIKQNQKMIHFISLKE